jgi:hypothetical protein
MDMQHLKTFEKSQFIETTQEDAVCAFHFAANKMQLSVCEDFRLIYTEFSDMLGQEIASLVISTHAGHCFATVLADKARRLLAETDSRIEHQTQSLRENATAVKLFSFSKFRSDLIDAIEIKLKKCMEKHGLQESELPPYGRHLDGLRIEVINKVNAMEISLRTFSFQQQLAKADSAQKEIRKYEQKITKIVQEMGNTQTLQKVRMEMERAHANVLKPIAELDHLMRKQTTEHEESVRQLAMANEAAQSSLCSFEECPREGGVECLLL